MWSLIKKTYSEFGGIIRLINTLIDYLLYLYNRMFVNTYSSINRPALPNAEKVIFPAKYFAVL